MGAMTIVEVIAAHNGFEIITSRIRTDKLSSLLLLIGVVTFFLSSVLDNLTTTIVMIALVRKVLDARADRLLFASMIVIAANAGGAFSPIGDVTTTMLWIGGQVSPLGIIKSTFIASLVNLLVPLIWLAFEVRGRRFQSVSAQGDPESAGTTVFERHLMFWMGLGILILVPAFKTATHLPPFMGILFGLGLLWLVGEIVHRDKEPEHRHPLTLVAALTRIDMSSIVFFVGILLAVAALEHAQLLSALAAWLDHAIGRKDLIVLILGLLSAIIDNVPLVAATMGMYSLTQFPPDSFQWEFIAYCAGTGGSILIIGSAAGVAAMGLEQIHFIWYMRKIGGLALAGYLAGAIAYIVQYQLMH
jgi:Na+/H+ antiporter NhaD/arsenite permease-like protein